MALIEQKAAVSAISDLLIHQLKGERLPTWNEVYHAIHNLTPVDAVPVRHGRWKEDPSGYGFWICSACGFVSEASAADILYKFCPVCGARMDGKDGDHHD